MNDPSAEGGLEPQREETQPLPQQSTPKGDPVRELANELPRYPLPFDAEGLLLGQYRFVRTLGRGGMATAHLCQQELGPDAALKFVVKVPQIALDVLDRTTRDRIGEELKSLVLLQHANIVKVVTAGTTRGVPWLLLNYLSGQTLAAEVATRPSTLERVLQWLHGVARALDYAHGKMVFHRDVKPSNLIFDEGDNLHVVDFGIARCMQEGRASSSDPRFFGSPPFCAPESQRATAAADLYSLAATVYLCLSGRHTHEFGELSLERKLALKATEPARDITQFVPGLPPGAAAALMKALEIEPARRFASCEQFATEFANGARAPGGGVGTSSGQPTALRPPSDEVSIVVADTVIPGFREVQGERSPLRCYVHEVSGIEFLLVPGGRILLGELPVRADGSTRTASVVEVGPFLLARHPITWQQWKDLPSPVVGRLMRRPKRESVPVPGVPVDRVRWTEARQFCLDLGCDLPTEAQWELACRCGADEPAPATDATAWTRENSQGVLRTVGTRQPNAWGFHDLLGSVHEWIADWFASDEDTLLAASDAHTPGAFRALKGGCVLDPAARCTAAGRQCLSPDSEIDFVGFRPALTLGAAPLK